MAVTAIIMAGGKSRRLGQDKRFLELGGRTCLQRVLDVCKVVFQDIIIVVDSIEAFQNLGVKVVADMVPGRATLGGLYTGLHYAPTSNVFAVACDMPFISAEAINVVLGQADQGDIVIPDLSGKLQPMHAVYSKRCLPYLRTLVEAKKLKVQDLCECPDLRVARIPESEFKVVDPELRSFFNINTPDDLAKAKRWLEEPV